MRRWLIRSRPTRIGLALCLLLARAWAATPATPPAPASGTPAPSVRAAGELISRGPSTARRIALSFDDGPGPDTEKFLDLLRRQGVRATFFVLGEEVERYPGTLKRLVQAGHEIGSHTFGHTNYLNHYHAVLTRVNARGGTAAQATARAREDLTGDLRRTQDLIQHDAGVRVTLCRMPYGIDRPWIKDAARDLGYTLVNWTYGADWKGGSAKDLIPGYVAALQPGAILLLHDGGKHRSVSLAVAEAVIRAARQRGLELVTVGELLQPPQR